MLLWNRLKYVLSPQFDVYEQVARIVRGKVADIGFGTGFGAHLLVQNAREVYAFDIDEDAVRFAQKVFPLKNLFFSYGNILKGIDSVFDYVLMIDVIEHIKQDKQVLLQIKKMLNKSGIFILSTPNRLSRYRKSADHVREYAPKELESLLKRVFVSVQLCNYALDPLVNPHENPLLAICKNEKEVAHSMKEDLKNG